jgi:hypothetical protein
MVIAAVVAILNLKKVSDLGLGVFVGVLVGLGAGLVIRSKKRRRDGA